MVHTPNKSYLPSTQNTLTIHGKNVKEAYRTTEKLSVFLKGISLDHYIL